MSHQIAARVHHALLNARSVLRREAGQGTVEYVALILLIATVMTAVVLTKGLDAGGIASSIVGKLKSSIENVGTKH